MGGRQRERMARGRQEEERDVSKKPGEAINQCV